MQAKDLINESECLGIKQGASNKTISQLALIITELDHNITTNYPKLPKADESYKSKVHRALISDIQVRLAEISVILRKCNYSSYPDLYKNCTNQQKAELDNIFIATKILSQAITHKLNVNIIEKGVIVKSGVWH